MPDLVGASHPEEYRYVPTVLGPGGHSASGEMSDYGTSPRCEHPGISVYPQVGEDACCSEEFNLTHPQIHDTNEGTNEPDKTNQELFRDNEGLAGLSDASSTNHGGDKAPDILKSGDRPEIYPAARDTEPRLKNQEYITAYLEDAMKDQQEIVMSLQLQINFIFGVLRDTGHENGERFSSLAIMARYLDEKCREFTKVLDEQTKKMAKIEDILAGYKHDADLAARLEKKIQVPVDNATQAKCEDLNICMDNQESFSRDMKAFNHAVVAGLARNDQAIRQLWTNNKTTTASYEERFRAAAALCTCRQSRMQKHVSMRLRKHQVANDRRHEVSEQKTQELSARVVELSEKYSAEELLARIEKLEAMYNEKE